MRVLDVVPDLDELHVELILVLALHAEAERLAAE